MRAFPNDFLWGATTSSHQHEGGNFHNDWWAWEQRPGRIVDGATSRTAADFANRYDADFQLAHVLGHNAHALTLEWSRVQPESPNADPAALEHYRSVLTAMRARDITPICALHHVTLPLWLRDGWLDPQALPAFQTYVHAVIEALGGLCTWWIPILEPMHTATQAYLDGLWPPQRRSWRAAWQALRTMAQAHAYAYERFRQHAPQHRVGVHIRAQHFEPFDINSAWDLRAARREEQRRVRSFIQGIRTGVWPRSSGFTRTVPSDFDFLAVAPSSRGVIQFNWRAFQRQWTRDATRGADPATAADLRAAIRALETYGRPLMILGDGIATNDDHERCAFLLDHIHTVQAECDAGVEIIGYLYRSLLDGFEWTRGYTARFGLIHVDWQSLARTPNPSAYLYRDIIHVNEIRPGVITRYAPTWHPPQH